MDIISLLKIVQIVLLVFVSLILAMALLMMVIVQNKNSEQFVAEKVQRLIKESGGTSMKIAGSSGFCV